MSEKWKYKQPQEDIVLPTLERLVASEKEALTEFFGRDIVIPEPPQELSQTLEEMLKLGINGFERHFLPKISLTEKDELPGWKVKPEPWFWQQIKSRRIAEDAATLKEGWYLVDGRREPHNQEGKQGHYNDCFGPIMKELRDNRRIQKHRDVTEISRFGASAEEIQRVILPTFARKLGIEGVVRDIRAIEFNVWGNMFHPEWGKSSTWEWFADNLKGGNHLIGGWSHGVSGQRYSDSDKRYVNVSVSGLTAVSYCSSVNRSEGIGFRPLVVISPKA